MKEENSTSMKTISKLILFIAYIFISLGVLASIMVATHGSLDVGIITLIGSLAVGLILIASSKLIAIVIEMGENIRSIREKIEVTQINKG